jgi:hypothetical protein
MHWIERETMVVLRGRRYIRTEIVDGGGENWKAIWRFDSQSKRQLIKHALNLLLSLLF